VTAIHLGQAIARPAQCHLPAGSAGHLIAGLFGVAARKDCRVSLPFGARAFGFRFRRSPKGSRLCGS